MKYWHSCWILNSVNLLKIHPRTWHHTLTAYIIGRKTFLLTVEKVTQCLQRCTVQQESKDTLNLIKWLEVNLVKISFKLHSSLKTCEVVLMQRQLFRKSQILISEADDKKKLKDAHVVISSRLPWGTWLRPVPVFNASKFRNSRYKLSRLCNV